MSFEKKRTEIMLMSKRKTSEKFKKATHEIIVLIVVAFSLRKTMKLHNFNCRCKRSQNFIQKPDLICKKMCIRHTYLHA